jgi:hypothetical protein
MQQQGTFIFEFQEFPVPSQGSYFSRALFFTAEITSIHCVHYIVSWDKEFSILYNEAAALRFRVI